MHSVSGFWNVFQTILIELSRACNNNCLSDDMAMNIYQVYRVLSTALLPRQSCDNNKDKHQND